MDKSEAVDLLIQLANRKLGYTPDSPADFDALSHDIYTHTGRTVSASTLKRMWGYVPYGSSPSPTTLASMCQYIGFPDWPTFVDHARYDAATETSGFLQEVVVNSADLTKGTLVVVDWSPRKCCTMEYLGRHRFRVISSDNIKLLEGDTFKLQTVTVGLPFYALDIRRGKLRIPGYIGARPQGVASLRVLPST